MIRRLKEVAEPAKLTTDRTALLVIDMQKDSVIPRVRLRNWVST